MKKVSQLIEELNIPQNPMEKAYEEPIMDIYRNGDNSSYSYYLADYHKEVEELNENIRHIVKRWRVENYGPSLRMMAIEIGIEASHFSRYLTGQKDLSLGKIDDILNFILNEEAKKGNRQYLKDLQLTNESVREAMNKWADDGYRPNFMKLTQKTGISYSMINQFKNNRTNLGKKNLKIVYDFLKEQVYEN